MFRVFLPNVSCLLGSGNVGMAPPWATFGNLNMDDGRNKKSFKNDNKNNNITKITQV